MAITLKALMDAAAMLGVDMDTIDVSKLMARGDNPGVKAEGYARKTGALADVDVPSKRKRVNGGGPSRQYTVIAARKGASKTAKAERKAAIEGMFHTLRQTWDYIVANDPCTALDIERGTRMGKKTVESCVWKLRDMGLIKSEPVA